MATVNKAFKIKNGLIVEGTTATVNGYDVLTKKPDDQNYIIGLIGGSATSNATPDTVVLRDENADFAAGTITADLVGDVTGTVSSLSNHSTTDLSEGTNLYYTDGRVKDVLTGATQTNISITEIGGVLHIEAENGVADSTTDDLDEGTTNKYYTDARARLALSEGTGINYDNTTGTISADLGDFDTDDLTEGATNKYFTTTRIDNHLSGGDGITYSAGTISADLGTGLEISGGQIAINRTTVDGWYDANGAAGDVATDLSNHINDTSTHGVAGDIVGTTDSQFLSNKEFLGNTEFHAGNGAGSLAIDLNSSTGAATITNNNDDLTITTNGGDIVLDPSGSAYVGSVSAGNEIATNAYVDNAVAGLDWKNAAHVLYDDANPVLSATYSTSPLSVDGHLFGSAENGLRVLVTSGNDGGSDAGIYVYNHGTTWTLTRATDADAYTELLGAAIYIAEGTQYGGTSWVQNNPYLTDFSAQSWTQFSGAGSVTAGTGITVDGLEVSVDRTTVDTWYDAAGDADQAVTDHNVSSGVHGVSGDIVGTSDSQTLTNKTIDASSNTLSNIPNSSLTNSSVTVNSNSVSLGDSITLDTDDISEGVTNEYFTQARARGSFSAGNAISYNSGTGEIAVDATQLDTGDISEGTNLYYTDSRVKSVLTNSTQTNISITEVAGQLTITAENGVADSTTDDLDEGITNHYFTDERAKIAAADLLVNDSTKVNLTITGDHNGLTITAENGVADSTTDDLDEGTTNLYFTDVRAVGAVSGADIAPNTVTIDTYRKEEATQQVVASASTVDVHQLHYPYGSAKYLVRVVGTVSGTLHSQVSEILMTVDGNDNIAITEYGTIYTSENPLATFSARLDQTGSTFYALTATTAVNGCEVIAAATMLSWAD